MTVTESMQLISKLITHLCVLLCGLVLALEAQAKLEIEIIQGNAAALPIAVVPFQWRAAGPPRYGHTLK